MPDDPTFFEDDLPEKPKLTPVEKAWRKVLGTPEGKIVFADLIQTCGVFANSFTGNSNTFFNLGRQEIGHHVLRRVAGEKLQIQEPLIQWLEILTEESNG